MNLNPLTNKLLYVPYGHEYTVCSEIMQKMTLDEFFMKCFVMPDFQKEMDAVANLVDDSIDDPEYLLTKQDLIRRYSKCFEDQENFRYWIQHNGGDVYCIRGNAGTGKTTYLHYLQYQYSEFDWDIIDVQKAIPRIRFLGYIVQFASFDLLAQKISSAILLSIYRDIYVFLDDGSINHSAMRRTIQEICKNYTECIDRYHPNREIASVFDRFNNVMNDTRELENEEFCIRFNRSFWECIQDLFRFHEQKTYDNHLETMEMMIEFYLIFLRCKSRRKKHIIAFDNIERFIGTDEIYNKEIIDMVQMLRHIHDGYYQIYQLGNRDRFAENYQFLVSMRNTSTRMFTPQQNADFLQSSIDISEWFSVNEIVGKKVKWYSENHINIEDYSELSAILADHGCAGERIRGLSTKLDLLFNSDKRLIVEFVNEMCNDPDYRKRSDAITFYQEKKSILEHGLAKFAIRTIRWKAILNRLISTPQFSFIFSSDDGNATSYYCYSILTILANYQLRENAEIMYMPFGELIEELYPNVDSPVSYFFDSNNKLERKKIGELLFNLNYFERRRGYWFQFIDIQYNMNSVQSIKIKNAEDLIKIIENSQNDIHSIKIRIMNCGKALVWYIMHSFEFFATRCNHQDSLLSDILPLIHTPALDIQKAKIVLNMEKVANNTLMYLQEYDNEANGCRYFLQKSIFDSGHSLAERVKNSHVGYVGNVHECLVRILQNENQDSETERFLQQLDALVMKIKGIYNRKQNVREG